MQTNCENSELRRCPYSALLLRAAGQTRLRSWCVRLSLRAEGGHFYSATARDILRKYYGVNVGAYSYGECMVPAAWPPGVEVGRYVSIAAGVKVFLRNHPVDHLSMHPFFYNKQLGFVETDTITSGTLTVGHDAWIGERAIITPGCHRIGIGAVVGAGAVVTKDVLDFGVVAGNPARLIRYRFPIEQQAMILESRWWERPVRDCVQYLEYMVRPLTDNFGMHPLIASVAEGSSSGGGAVARH